MIEPFLFALRRFGTLFLWKYANPAQFYYLRKNLRPSFSRNLLRVTHYHIFNFNFYVFRKFCKAPRTSNGCERYKNEVLLLLLCILDLPFNEGDSVMANKGFTISDILPLGVSLNIPPFLGTSTQMPPEDVMRTQEIARLWIQNGQLIKLKIFIYGIALPH